MSKYVSRVVAMRNGSRVQHLKNFKKDPVKYREKIKLMNGTGTVDVTKEFSFSIDYVIPKVGAKIDWSDVEGENWSFPLEGGSTLEYTDVDSLDEGEFTVDGEKETVMTLMFQAGGRSIR